jgi:glutathione synthase/RimK-type ligase-like ATP-grasp enzyme
MKVAINHRKGSFSDRWIVYCEKNNIDYKIVNAFDSDIIQQVNDCDVFMWHHHHNEFKDVLTAKRILFALEHSGIKVFPDFKTSWHFDDKVAQKYLFEAIDAPIVPSHVFYDKENAISWARTAIYPKVFKLKGGAGASNVKLVKNEKEAIKLIKRSFGSGFSQFDKLGYLHDSIQKYKTSQVKFIVVVKACARLFMTTGFAKMQPPEKGYIYFQDFIPDNDSDLRVIIIDGKAFAVKRMVRNDDFRASGSGIAVYDKNEIDHECIKIAFEVNNQLSSMSVAFDFVWDKEGKPYLIELSYGFKVDFYDQCPGYWDENLQWYEGTFNPQEWIISALLQNRV